MNQSCIPSYDQRVNEARRDLQVLVNGIGLATRHTNAVKAARTYIINVTNTFSQFTLQKHSILNINLSQSYDNYFNPKSQNLPNTSNNFKQTYDMLTNTSNN